MKGFCVVAFLSLAVAGVLGIAIQAVEATCVRGNVENAGAACNTAGESCATLCVIGSSCGVKTDDCAPTVNKACNASADAEGCCQNTGTVACTNTHNWTECKCIGIFETGVCVLDEDTTTSIDCGGNKQTAAAC